MLPELLSEIEEKFRQFIREEVRAALLESENPNFAIKSDIEEINKVETKISNIQNDYPQILIAQEVAEILGVSVQRIYELTRQRESNGLPVIVLGERQYRYSKEAILKWMERDYK